LKEVIKKDGPKGLFRGV